MPTPWYLDPTLQTGTYAAPGSDLYNLRIKANQSHGVPAAAYSGGMSGVETGITGGINTFMQGQAEYPFLRNLPGYQGMRQQQSENILDQLQGNVPTDVVNQILTRAAERGIMTGSPGSPNANSSYLRALGLTSLDMMKQGSEGLSRAIEQTPVAELVNPWSLYVPERLGKMELDAAKQGATRTGSGNPWIDNYEDRFGWIYPHRWTGPSGAGG